MLSAVLDIQFDAAEAVESSILGLGRFVEDKQESRVLSLKSGSFGLRAFAFPGAGGSAFR